jgi:predicted glycosyltransferase
MIKLFLDDIREAPDKTWDVVRSYHEFIGYILVYGVPDIISFDHDLEFKSRGSTTSQYTGYDCAKYLVDNNLEIKEFIVHSANLIGKENIEKLLINWKTFCLKEKNQKGEHNGQIQNV